MPELPEVEALVGFARERLIGQVVARVDVAAVSVLKTYDPPPAALAGGPVVAVTRHGKWVDVDVDGLHLVFHLAKAGWLRWSDELPDRAARPGKGPTALRVAMAYGSGFDLTEAGTRKRLAVYVVRAPDQVPAIASLGPDPLDPAFDRATLAAVLAGRRAQLKGVLREQSVLAGVGNAYSDEVLHAARLSPYALAATLTVEQLDRLYASLRSVLADAVAAARGRPASELKDAKRAGMRVHGRAGQPCPVCGAAVREVTFADSALHYCPTCQTGGRPLADRSLSRLLK